MSLFPFFEWCDNTAISAWIRDTTWSFPVIETFHILALTLLYGTILIVDLRLLGMGMRRQPTRFLAGELRSWMNASLAVILVTGVLLFLSEAIRCYGNDGFRFKMVFLFFAVTFHFTAFRRATAADDESRMSLGMKKVVALVSMTLWLAVGVGGRAIAFV
ncbi:MAG: hypothetical protein A3G76_01225 [Acidobacteria bacterium RIFCSPLOWO2_12_FULL_65_11]|nr:MAG: hypothetical protein A3G76_01225 [Acidobacteria bacterium RIFCSPLOWO2_12_FULL_65_11]